MRLWRAIWLVGFVFMVGVAWGQPSTPPLPSTDWSRGYLTNTTPAAARTYLGLAETNVAVTLLPYANQFETNGGTLALSATVSNQLATGAAAVSASAAARELLFTLPTDDATMLGVIHPSCWYGSTNWNGYRYWLAYTTWPGVEREAIYLAVSQDGQTWLPAPGTTDGRIGPNGADTETVMLNDGSLCIFYLYAGVGGTTNNIDYLRSADGTTWTTNRAFTVTNALALGSAASPAIVQERDGTFRMWFHDKTTAGDGTTGDPYSMAQIYTLTSTYGTNWDITTAAACPSMTNGWHFDVARIGSNYYLLRCNEAVQSQGPPKAYTSTDGTNWTRLPGAGFQMPPGLLGPYRADLVPVNSWPPTFDVWWNNWDSYSATADATNSTSRIGRSQWVTLPYAPLDWGKSNTLVMANTFFGSDSSTAQVMPFAYPWSVAGVGALKMKYVANLGSGGLLYTNSGASWGLFGLDAFAYKYDAAGSLGGGLLQTYETAPKSPSQFRLQWQVKLLTNSAAQIGLYKYGTFGSSVGTLTNIMIEWNTTGTNMAWLCVTNGSTSQRVAFDGVPDVSGTSHTANSALVELEKSEWGKITARIFVYPTTYTATAAFADTTALWWTPFVAWKGTNGVERFDLRTKVNFARGASEFPTSAGLSVNAISMFTNGPIVSTGFIGDGQSISNVGTLQNGTKSLYFANPNTWTTPQDFSASNITASGTVTGTFTGDGGALTNLAPPIGAARPIYAQRVTYVLPVWDGTNQWVQTSCVLSTNTTEVWSGSAGLTMTFSGNGDNACYAKRTVTATNLSSSFFTSYFYIHPGTNAATSWTNIDSVFFYVYDTNANYLRFNLAVDGVKLLHPGWNWSDVTPYVNYSGTNAGSYDWSCVSQFRLYFATKSPYLTTPSVTWGGLIGFEKPNRVPVVCLGFDGGYSNHVYVGRELNRRGMVGYFNVDHGSIGVNPAKMTLPELLSLKRDGHLICSYPYTGSDGVARNWQDKTLAQKLSDTRYNSQWLIANGLGEGSRIMSTPSGSLDTNDLNTVIGGTVDMITGTGHESNSDGMPQSGWDVRWFPYCVGPSTTNTYRFWAIDALLAKGGIANFIFHSCASGTQDISWVDFVAFLDYLQPYVDSGRIAVRLPTDVLRGNVPPLVPSSQVNAGVWGAISNAVVTGTNLILDANRTLIQNGGAGTLIVTNSSVGVARTPATGYTLDVTGIARASGTIYGARFIADAAEYYSHSSRNRWYSWADGTMTWQTSGGTVLMSNTNGTLAASNFVSTAGGRIEMATAGADIAQTVSAGNYVVVTNWNYVGGDKRISAVTNTGIVTITNAGDYAVYYQLAGYVSSGTDTIELALFVSDVEQTQCKTFRTFGTAFARGSCSFGGSFTTTTNNTPVDVRIKSSGSQAVQAVAQQLKIWREID